MMGIIEADETYIGGKKKYVGRGYKGNKTPVFSMVQRGGGVRSQVMERVTGQNLKQAIRDNVVVCSDVHTDDNFAYRGMGPKFEHKVVKHSAGEYVRKEKGCVITTNSAEGFFSLLKRGINGVYHQVSKKHLPLYLAEFDYRYNTRQMKDGERTVQGLKKVEGKRLTYKPLTKA